MPTTGIDRTNQTKTLWILTAAVATGLIAAMFIPGIGIPLILVQVGFLVLHGAWRYGWRAIAVFIVAGLVISNILENLSVQTGFPFGHYHYTGDGKIFHVPWYIGPAYLATGYLAWIVATTLLADVHHNSPWLTTIGTPIVGAVAMTSWDLAMDPSSATINQWWIWENGGGFFGVPLVNFLGWTLTVYLYMQAFALYLRSRGPAPSATQTRTVSDLQAVILYAATTLSFFAAYLKGDRIMVTDATGHTWQTSDIYQTSILLAVHGMLFLALLALLRIAQQHSERPETPKSRCRQLTQADPAHRPPKHDYLLRRQPEGPPPNHSDLSGKRGSDLSGKRGLSAERWNWLV